MYVTDSRDVPGRPQVAGSRLPCAHGASTTVRSTRSTGPAAGGRARSSSVRGFRSTASPAADAPRSGRSAAAARAAGAAAGLVRLGRVGSAVRPDARGRVPLAGRRLLRPGDGRHQHWQQAKDSSRTVSPGPGRCGPRRVVVLEPVTQPPREVHVKPGDSLAAIADRYSTTLRRSPLNKLIPRGCLLIGRSSCDPPRRTTTDASASGVPTSSTLGRNAASTRRSPLAWMESGYRRTSPPTRGPGA